jgi:hypothetical protein
MWRSRYCRKIERRAQMLLTPYNVLRANVDAPNLTLFRKIVQPSDHPP